MDLPPPAVFTASLGRDHSPTTTKSKSNADDEDDPTTGTTTQHTSSSQATVTRKRSRRPHTADSHSQSPPSSSNSRLVFSSAVSSFANFSPGGMSIMSPASATMSAWSSSIKAPTMSVSSFATDSTTGSSSFIQHEIAIPEPRARRTRRLPDRLMLEKRKKRHHAYGERVPYPCSYEPFVLDQ